VQARTNADAIEAVPTAIAVKSQLCQLRKSLSDQQNLMQEMQARGRSEVLRFGVLGPDNFQFGLRDRSRRYNEAISRQQSRLVDRQWPIASNENTTSFLAS
jgi:hypothetical protein